MKMIIAFVALVAVALAAPAEKDVVVVKEALHDNIGVGGYSFNYELSNGETRQETAQLKTVQGEEGPQEAVVVSGSYSFVDPLTNIVYKVTYVADENGFQAQGDHIPV